MDALICVGDASRPLQAEIDTQLAHSLSVGGMPAICVRYKDHNDEQAQYLIVDGKAWGAGGPALSLLGQAIEDAEAGKILMQKLRLIRRLFQANLFNRGV